MLQTGLQDVEARDQGEKIRIRELEKKEGVKGMEDER